MTLELAGVLHSEPRDRLHIEPSCRPGYVRINDVTVRVDALLDAIYKVTDTKPEISLKHAPFKLAMLTEPRAI